MGKYNRYQSDSEAYGKCEICLSNIRIRYYFGVGDEITCYECDTTYIIESKFPGRLKIINDRYLDDSHFGDIVFEDY